MNLVLGLVRLEGGIGVGLRAFHNQDARKRGGWLLEFVGGSRVMGMNARVCGEMTW